LRRLHATAPVDPVPRALSAVRIARNDYHARARPARSIRRRLSGGSPSCGASRIGLQRLRRSVTHASRRPPGSIADKARRVFAGDASCRCLLRRSWRAAVL
jgi:hypothetical protein